MKKLLNHCKSSIMINCVKTISYLPLQHIFLFLVVPNQEPFAQEHSLTYLYWYSREFLQECHPLQLDFLHTGSNY